MTLIVLSILVLIILVADLAHWRLRGGRFSYLYEVSGTRPIAIALTIFSITVGVLAVLYLLRVVSGELFMLLGLSFGIAQSSYSIYCRELQWRRGRGTLA